MRRVIPLVRRRRAGATFITAVLAVAVAATLAASLAGCGGGGSDTAPPPSAAAPERLKPSQPGELLAHVKKVLRDQRLAGPGVQGALLGAGAPAAAPTTGSGGNFSGRSNTTVQESGVDEEDLIKTDGTHLYTLYPRLGIDAANPRLGVLDVHARQGASGVSKVGSLVLPLDAGGDGPPQAGAAAMHLAAAVQRAAVVGQVWRSQLPPFGQGGGATIVPMWSAPSVYLHIVAVGTPASPRIEQRLSLDGELVGSRRIGNMLYLATSHTPRLQPGVFSADAAAQDAALAQLQLAEVLPRLRVDGGAAQALVTETDCYTQPANASPLLQVTTLIALDLATLNRSSRCFVGGSEALYMSAQQLVLATSRYFWSHDATVGGWASGAKTDLHQFAFDDAALSYRASGSVEGHLGWDRERRALRLSDHAGHLRVLTFTGSFGWRSPADAGTQPASPATLTVLKANGSQLEVVATLPNAQRPAPIGKPGEQVFGVRFAGDRGYVVTFRRIDPLYVLDLSNPADPRAVGELEVPGYSDYLYPLSNGLLLGVGRDADAQGIAQGLKLGLFDVSNPAAPRELASKGYGGRFSQSALDTARQGLNLFEQGGIARAALPLALTDDDGRSWNSGLLRVTIDTAAKTWGDAPLLPAVAGSAPEVWTERATQIDNTVFYFSRGELRGFAW